MTNKKQDEAARIRNAVLNLIEVLDADEPDWRPIDGETTDYDIAWNQLIEIVENPNLPIREAIISEITKNGPMKPGNLMLQSIQHYEQFRTTLRKCKQTANLHQRERMADIHSDTF